MWTASDPAEREEGLPLRPRFEEAEEHERDGSGVAHASSIESTVTRVENSLIWSDSESAATRRCSARRRSRRRKMRAYACVRMRRRCAV